MKKNHRFQRQNNLPFRFVFRLFSHPLPCSSVTGVNFFSRVFVFYLLKYIFRSFYTNSLPLSSFTFLFYFCKISESSFLLFLHLKVLGMVMKAT
jgi:hypothetical protein